MRRSTSLILAAIGFSLFILLLSPALSVFLADITDSLQYSDDSLSSTENTLLVQRAPEGSRRDFCSKVEEADGSCSDSPVVCPEGFTSVCQGSCACGGSMCQCVRNEVSESPNVCGNGVCEATEFRADDAGNLVPLCEKDCRALARSEFDDRACAEETLGNCLNGKVPSLAFSYCHEESIRVCGTSEAACEGTVLATCIDEQLTHGQEVRSAVLICTARCYGETVTAIEVASSSVQATSTSASSADEVRSAPEEEILTEQPVYPFIEKLKSQIRECGFQTLGRCCEVAATFHDPALMDACISVCTEKGVPDGNTSTCAQ